MQVKGCMDPVVFTSDACPGWKAVVMPMRL